MWVWSCGKILETFRQWVGVELSAENGLMLYQPGDFARGYMSLTDEAEIYCQVNGNYVPDSARGFRWDDRAFGIEWPPLAPLKINKRDREYPLFTL